MCPYIRKELRPPIDEILDKLIERLSEMQVTNLQNQKELAGNLTYIVFKLIKHFYKDGKWYDKMDAEKVCNSAWREFARRFLDSYEDEAIQRNGDVQ